jgi:hypothetical protein
VEKGGCSLNPASKYPGKALERLIRAMGARDIQWFDGYFEERLAHDPGYLFELLAELASVSEDEIFMDAALLKRLFRESSALDIDANLQANRVSDPEFLRGLVLGIAQTSRNEIKAKQKILAGVFC